MDRIHCITINEVTVKAKEKYFKTKDRPTETLLKFLSYEVL